MMSRKSVPYHVESELSIENHDTEIEMKSTSTEHFQHEQ